jgi:hypothetical protein
VGSEPKPRIVSAAIAGLTIDDGRTTAQNAAFSEVCMPKAFLAWVPDPAAGTACKGHPVETD